MANTTNEPTPPSAAAPASILVQRRIEWPDTDASGHWHNTAAFRFIEMAETALLERLDMLKEVYGRLPRVHIAADFKALLSFRDVVDCVIVVKQVGDTSLTYDFEIRREGEVCVTATVVVALLDTETRSPAAWSSEHRRLLLESGPQAPELILVG